MLLSLFVAAKDYTYQRKLSLDYFQIPCVIKFNCVVERITNTFPQSPCFTVSFLNNYDVEVKAGKKGQTSSLKSTRTNSHRIVDNFLEVVFRGLFWVFLPIV